MRKLKLSELLKTAAAFTAVSALTVDGALLFTEATIADIPGEWYYLGPLGTWVAVGIPTTTVLIERLLGQLDIKPGRIIGFSEDGPSPFWRGIPFTSGGKSSTLLANTAPNIFGETLPTGGGVRYTVWDVPVNGVKVRVHEMEMEAFLNQAGKRDKYQFSRKYWLKTRRPPLYRNKYDAFMRLLCEAGMVEGRHAQGGASGYLVTKPHFALTYLTKESCYAVTR